MKFLCVQGKKAYIYLNNTFTFPPSHFKKNSSLTALVTSVQFYNVLPTKYKDDYKMLCSSLTDQKLIGNYFDNA